MLARRCPTPVLSEVAVNGRISESVELAAYYVVAEVRTNAVKYSQAGEIALSARQSQSCLHLEVCHDGCGGAVIGKGSGLVGLADRVESLGRTLSVTSPAGVRIADPVHEDRVAAMIVTNPDPVAGSLATIGPAGVNRARRCSPPNARWSPARPSAEVLAAVDPRPRCRPPRSVAGRYASARES